jgi:hypothetical protein
MCQPRPKLAKLSRTRDVNHIWPEFLQRAPHESCMSPKKQVVAEIAFNAETRAASWKLEMPNRSLAVLRHGWTGSNREKRPLMPRGKIHELPRRQRNAVDLAKCFAE